MQTISNMAEARLKAAVIDRLLSSKHIDDDAVLISEMTVANWSRRADVVLANGRLWGFELKSEADSLSRLEGQIETFRAHFEKLTIVIADRFFERVLRLVPDGVGVWVAESDGLLTERVKTKSVELSSSASISLMTAVELRQLLAGCGSKCAKATRGQLEAIARDLAPEDLAAAARSAIKARHRTRYQEFIRYQAAHGTLPAMAAMRKARAQHVANVFEEAPATVVQCKEPHIPAGHPCKVDAPAGPILRRAVSLQKIV